MLDIHVERDNPDDERSIRSRIEFDGDICQALGECFCAVDTMYKALNDHDKDIAKDFFLGLMIGLPFMEHFLTKPEDFEHCFEDPDDDCDDEDDDEDEDDSDEYASYGTFPSFRGIFYPED